ncbi:helix-turn-helix domain-containing protein [Acidithiobacillus sp. MC6.1]|nr:helix-turn-helix domain-containing protein [Acidithiobacillus sp. MC6.1]
MPVRKAVRYRLGPTAEQKNFLARASETGCSVIDKGCRLTIFSQQSMQIMAKPPQTNRLAVTVSVVALSPREGADDCTQRYCAQHEELDQQSQYIGRQREKRGVLCENRYQRGCSSKRQRRYQ